MRSSTAILIAAIATLTWRSAVADYKADLRANSIDSTHGCTFTGDSVTLSVAENDKTLLQRSFCSSYGRGSARVASDSRGRTYVLLQLSEGRGSNATTDYLIIYRLSSASHESDLDEIMRVPISWGTGPSSRLVYDYSVDTANGLTLSMSWRIEGGGETCCLPADRRRVISIDSK